MSQSTEGITQRWPYSLRVFTAGLCLHTCFLLYGIVQERLITKDRVVCSIGLVLSNRLAGALLSAFVLRWRGKPLFPAVPLYRFACFSMSNDMSTWASYEMLKYMSFPCQVLTKTCKLVPVMIMGSILNNQRYTRWEYAQAFVMGSAMTVLVYSSTEEKTPPLVIKLDPDSWEHFFRTLCTNSQYTVGAAFLLLYYVCDSFTSNWQAKLYKEHKISEHQMMFAGNFCAMIFMGFSAVIQPRPLLDTYNMIRSDVWILWRIVVLSICAALGQLWIYHTIKEFGPLVFTSIMTLRQIFSVLLSIFWFGHECTPLTAICMSAVFGVVIAQQLVKVYNYSCKHKRKKEE